MAPEGPQRVDVDGLTVALLDTTTPGRAGGQVPAAQVERLEDLANEADHPGLVHGPHPPRSPDSAARPPRFFGISTDASERITEERMGGKEWDGQVRYRGSASTEKKTQDIKNRQPHK